jgi:hypothetical protein
MVSEGVLKGTELVVESIAGTRRLYRINPSGLQAVRDFIDRFWETALDNFAILAAAEAESGSAGTGTRQPNNHHADGMRGA